MQSKRASIIEAVVNTFIGFIITCVTAPIIYYSLDIRMSIGTLTVANILFTLVSVIRNYIVRRLFNRTQIFTIKQKE